MENTIKEYGNTITGNAYNDILQGHPYIPQSDHKIVKIIGEKQKAKMNHCWFTNLAVDLVESRLISRAYRMCM